MQKSLLSQSILAGLLALASSAALAVDFYVVAPLPGKQHLVDGISIALNATPLPTGVVGAPYAGFNLSSALQVSGDPAFSPTNVGWSVVAGTLPAGLTMNKGVITGTPSAAGAQAFTVRATYKTKTGEQAYQLFTYAVSVALATGSLPQGVAGVAYPTYDLKPLLTVAGDPGFNPANVVWTVVSNTLPAGLTLKANGTIAGTPTASGTGAVTARANYKGVTGEQTYQVVTLGITVNLATETLPQGVAGVAYPAYDLKPLLAVAGDPSFNLANVTWTVVSSTLPAGLTLKADGTISGTPTTSGTGTVTARASYKGVNGEQTYQVITMGLTVSLAPGTLPQGVAGIAYPTYDLKPLLAVHGDPSLNPANVAWTVVSSTLPAGLTLKADGTISGTPTVAGTGTLVARASYKGVNGEQTYQVVTMGLTVSLTTATLPAGVAGTAYGGYDLKPHLSVVGDPGYSSADSSWTVTGGSLIAGLALSPSGVLAGTPTEGATKSFTVQAAYKGKQATQTYNLSTEVGLTAVANYRTWSDGTLAANCNAYKNPSLPRTYAGATGDGVYRIQPDGQAAINAYCDMTTNGGGYTVVLTVRDNRYDPSGVVTVATDSAPSIPGQSTSSYLPRGVALALAQASSEVRIQEVGTSKAIWSSNATVMANLRAGVVANYTATPVTDTTSYWQQSYAGVAQFNTTCETLRTPAVVSSNYPSIFWACGNQTGLHVTDGSFAAWFYNTANGAMGVSYR